MQPPCYPSVVPHLSAVHCSALLPIHAQPLLDLGLLVGDIRCLSVQRTQLRLQHADLVSHLTSKNKKGVLVKSTQEARHRVHVKS